MGPNRAAVFDELGVRTCCWCRYSSGLCFHHIDIAEDMMVWFHRGFLSYPLSTIRARHQSNLGLKDFIFLSGILMSLSNNLMTVAPALLKGPFF